MERIQKMARIISRTPLRKTLRYIFRAAFSWGSIKEDGAGATGAVEASELALLDIVGRRKGAGRALNL
jgi:hypothetical protein